MDEKGYGQQTSEEENFQELGEGQHDELASSSSHNLSVGKRVPGFLIPTVEALVLGRKIRDDGSTDVSLLIAPHIKKGVWIKAAVYVRNSQKIAKRVVERYSYPLPWAQKLAYEAVRHKADAEWVKNTLEDINNFVKNGSKGMHVAEPEGVDEEQCKKVQSMRDKSSSSSDTSVNEVNTRRPVKPHRSHRRSPRRLSAFRHWSSVSSDNQEQRSRKTRDKPKIRKKRGIWPNSPRVRRAAAKAVRSSSSGSSESSPTAGRGGEEVWESDQEDDGLVDCPFTSRDIRRYIDVREAIKGKATERRFIRQALHNLYRHYTSLQTFVDSIRAKTLTSSSSQPYPSELVWLEHHAIYIDCLLFESLRGMWGQWQEPVLDLLVMSLLELVVRCSPRRQYPDKLEERVRRWMKKNRVGLSSSYGVLPFFLQNAKVSERGVQINNSQYGRGRPSTPFSRQTENRGRGTNGFNLRRGGFKPENKTGSHE